MRGYLLCLFVLVSWAAACSDDETSPPPGAGGSQGGSGGTTTSTGGGAMGGGGGVGATGGMGGSGGEGATMPTGNTATWSGNGADPSWTTAENWTGDVAPVPGDAIVFPSTAARLTSVNDYGDGTAFADITFNGGGYHLTGDAIELIGNVTTTNSTGRITISTPLILEVPTTFTVSNAGEPDDLSLNGDISGAGGLTKAGPGAIVLSNFNTYAGPTAINAGALRLGASDAIPDASAVTVGAGASLGLAGNSDTLGSLAGPGALFIGTGALTVGASNMSTTCSGAMSGSGSLIKVGTGSLTLSGSSAGFNGTTVVDAGTLFVNGNLTGSAVTVSAGAVLAGTGSVASIVAVATAGVSPGTSPGILTTGFAALAGAVLTYELNGTTAGTQYDGLNCAGSINLGGSTLDATLGYVPSQGNTLTIVVAAGGVTGTFAGLPDLSIVNIGGESWQIDYTATTVTLTNQ